MPDVFSLQASVSIDTSEANRKLDELLAKAKQLDDDLSNPGNGNNGGGGGNGGTPNPSGDNNGGNGPQVNPTAPTGGDGTTDAIDDATKVTKGAKLLKTIAEVGGMFGAAGAAGVISIAPYLIGGLLYSEENDISKANRVRNSNYDLEQYNALAEWIDLSNQLAENGFDMTGEQITAIETRRGEIMGQYGNGREENQLFNRYFDYINANNLDSMVGDIMPQLEELGITVPVAPEVDENAAAEITEQIGPVTIPATVTVTNVNGGGSGVGAWLLDAGGNILEDAGGALLEGIGVAAASLFGKRKKSVGMERVPTDNFVVALHQDEAVLTRTEAAEWRSRTGNQSMTAFDFANAIRGVNVYLGPDQVGHLISGPVGANINSRQNYKLRSMGG